MSNEMSPFTGVALEVPAVPPPWNHRQADAIRKMILEHAQNLVFVWHAHHEQLFSVYQNQQGYESRLEMLKFGSKPAHETPRRLRLIKPMTDVPEDLKILYWATRARGSTDARYIDPLRLLRLDWYWDQIVSDKTLKEQEISPRATPSLLWKIIDLHTEQCGPTVNHPQWGQIPTCPWDGETIFPELKDDATVWDGLNYVGPVLK